MENIPQTQHVRFALYELQLVQKEMQLSKYLIVLKWNDVIIGWTDFNQYIKRYDNHSVGVLGSDDKQKFMHIIKMLNYIIFDRQLCNSVSEITVDMVAEFLQKYALCELPSDDETTHRSVQTCEKAVATIIGFFDALSRKNHTAIKRDDFYKKVKVFNKHKKRLDLRTVPVFEINALPEKEKTVYRNLPDSAFKILINVINQRYPQILMLSALCAFGGLRPAEACNVRREDSVLGAGLIFNWVDGECLSIKIDLQKERQLRSDQVSVGRIKKPRIAQIYPVYIPYFLECYDHYMHYLQGREYESDYGPLSINSRGMAMTYDLYWDYFKKASKDAAQVMLRSDEPEVVAYGNVLLTANISPHILRHWFSQSLAMMGASINDLMTYRGDRSPESCLVYLQNKSDLTRKLENTSSEMFETLLEDADVAFGEADHD